MKWAGLPMTAPVLAAVLGLAACAPMPPAPVEQRDPRPATAAVVVPSTYAVQRGDTLYSISFRYRLDWREVASWNRIDAPYLIRPGQELRLVPPPRRLAGVAKTETTPLPSPTPSPAPRQQPIEQAAPPPIPRPQPEPAPAAPAEARQPSPSPGPAVATRRVAGVDWRWPTAGSIARPFDPGATRRGIGIAGRSGQSVVAAADGQVVYSGTALIGYGELIIIKHSDTLLSAYAHNRVRLVEEGVRVRGGQPIAEMGISDRNEELLHFEVRRNGQPVNPLDFLPSR
ncbi:MAG: peptidoglycan DD-metalloendopeptidase family protein [Wenzhouxiangella sp.]